MAAKELARLWCGATHEGEGQAFEKEWFAEASSPPAFLCDAEPSPEPSPKRERSLDAWASTAAVAGVRVEAERAADDSTTAVAITAEDVASSDQED